jgi:hypothetical protein
MDCQRIGSPYLSYIIIPYGELLRPSLGQRKDRVETYCPRIMEMGAGMLEPD